MLAVDVHTIRKAHSPVTVRASGTVEDLNTQDPTSDAMEGQEQNDELFPIAVLIDELKVRTTRPGKKILESDTILARRCAPTFERNSSPVDYRARFGSRQNA